MSADSPLRQSLRAARANLGPGLVLQAFALALLAAYTWHAPTRAALEGIARWRGEIGLPADMATTAFFGAALPWLVLQLRPSTRGRQTPAQTAGLAVFWAYKGVEVSLFYALQARVFGEGKDFATIALKTFADQFVYCPAFAVPVTWLVYTWIEHRYDARPLLADLRRPGWYARCCVPLLVATWGVWVPAVAVIYLLPTALQLPMQNIVLCFFTLLVTFLTSRRAAEMTGK